MNDLYEIAKLAPTPDDPERREFDGLYVWPDGGIAFSDDLSEQMLGKMRKEVERGLERIQAESRRARESAARPGDRLLTSRRRTRRGR